jgi:hypothetical protein
MGAADGALEGAAPQVTRVPPLPNERQRRGFAEIAPVMMRLRAQAQRI